VPTTVPRAGRAEWTRLAEPATGRAERFDPALVAELPEPARRWLTHAIAPGVPLARSVELSMRGEIRLGGWRSFVVWTSRPGENAAVAVWHIDEQQETVQLEVEPDGHLAGVLVQPWGNPDGEPYGRYPFGVTIDAERSFGAITIPAALRAGWWWGTDRHADGEFFRAEITAATFRPTGMPIQITAGDGAA
jgi:hypothetical protein